jgi:putative aminopeptidase FrvX
MLDKNLQKIIEELSRIPNAPFSLIPRTQYVMRKLTDAGLEVEDTPYYILGKTGNPKAERKLVIMSHLDHPGFIFRNSTEAIAFGTLYFDKLDLKKLPPLNIHTADGHFLGKANITDVFGRDYSRVKVKGHFKIPKNSQGQWDVGTARISEERVEALSNDNDIVTSVLLSIAQPLPQSDWGIYFLFTKHEEVIQQSSYEIAAKNLLDLSENDLVINLESMKAYSLVDSGEFERLSYERGVVLNVSEKDSVYGASFPNSRNLAESLVNNTAEKEGVEIQRGIAGGSSDAWTFSESGITPSIVTLNIPNQFKHNVDNENVVAEVVATKDVVALQKILREAIEGVPNGGIPENSEDISLQMKQKYPHLNDKRFIRTVNDRLRIRFKDVIRRGYYFPVSISDHIQDLFNTLISYLSYIISRKTDENGKSVSYE